MGEAVAVSLADRTQEQAAPFLLYLPESGPERRQELRSGWVKKMPWKYREGIVARKSVAKRFREFLTAMMRQFKTPPDELLDRAEERLRQTRSPPTAPDAQDVRR